MLKWFGGDQLWKHDTKTQTTNGEVSPNALTLLGGVDSHYKQAQISVESGR